MNAQEYIDFTEERIKKLKELRDSDSLTDTRVAELRLYQEDIFKEIDWVYKRLKKLENKTVHLDLYTFCTIMCTVSLIGFIIAIMASK